MKTLTPSTVIAIICLGFAFAGLVVLSVAIVEARVAVVFIAASYLAAALYHWRNCK